MKKLSEEYKKNIKLLFEGYWYSDLPPMFDYEKYNFNWIKIIENIHNGGYDKYFNESKQENEPIGFIKKFKNVKSPSYIYNDGIEPIIYFEFKKNGALREMQVPNLMYYSSFVYNTMSMYEKIFIRLYEEENFKEYINYSNSYIIFDSMFVTQKNYEGIDEQINAGEFAVKNTKLTSQLTYNKNNIRYLEMQNHKLYIIKIDIESFFPNIYTHYLGKIKEFEPFLSKLKYDEYFEFLDYYNMKINNNQTKGIPAGVFSSSLASELLMICVDYEINKIIGEDVQYIRYVDDLTFFSDSYETIKAKLPSVQRALNKFRLRINNNKTEEKKSIYNVGYVGFQELINKFDFINKEKTELNKDVFFNIKSHISYLIDEKKISEVKGLLTMIKNSIENDKLYFNDEENIKFEKYFVFYMLQLLCIEPLLSTRCYRIISTILEKSKEKDFYNDILKRISEKSEYINRNFNDTILQIWHYYVLSIHTNLDIEQLKSDFDKNEINPIIITFIIKDGKGKNRKVFNYIKSVYEDLEHKEGEKNYWQKSIMFSKWWLPIFTIYYKDKKNYHRFFESNNFPAFYKDIVSENIVNKDVGKLFNDILDNEEHIEF